MRRRRRTSILTAVAVVVALGLAGLLVVQGFTEACRDPGNDLSSYLLSSRAMLNGENPYATSTPFPYIYPLLLALLVTPLTWMPCVASSLSWSAVLLTGLGASLKMLRPRSERAIDPGAPASAGPRAPWAAWFALTILLFDVVQNNLVNGQVNLVVLLACVAGWTAHRRGHGTLAAAGFGTAAALKIFPLILLVPLVVRRRWREAASTVAVTVVLCLLPGVLPGVDPLPLYGDYVRDFLGARLADGPERPGSVQFGIAGWLAESGMPVGPLGAAIVALALVAAVAAWDRRRVVRGDGFSRPALATYLLIPLFVVPMSQVHHLVMALPAWTLALDRAFDPNAPRARWLLLVAATAYLVGSLAWRDGPLYSLSLLALAGAALDAPVAPDRASSRKGSSPRSKPIVLPTQ